MVDAYASADYYKDQIVSNIRIGDEFSGCKFSWSFPAGLLVLKNDSIETDIEYSFDGEHVAGRLKCGTDAKVGGESFTYERTIRMKIYARRSHNTAGVVEHGTEVIIPYRLYVNKEPDFSN